MVMDKAKQNNIFLIGPMGAGKSSVGRYLAKLLQMEFYDSDEEIEKSTGVNLGWIFDVEGEEGFRKREAGVIAALVKRTHIILATGGGTVVVPENQKNLAERGCIVYLEVSLKNQEPRVVNDIRRPLLQVDNRLEVMERLQEEREPIYQKLADFRVQTDNRSVRAVADDIIAWLKKETNR
jgi:shikimate kinase